MTTPTSARSDDPADAVATLLAALRRDSHHFGPELATLAAARQQYPTSRIWAVWQPHTYSRTRTLLADFAACFSDADQVVVLDIYASREKETLGLTGAGVAQAIQHHQVAFVAQIEAAAAYLLPHLQPGDLLITFSAGVAREGEPA